MVENINIAAYQTQFGNGTDYILVDVREEDEYEEGHLPNAINIPLSDLQASYDDLDSAKPIVLVCARGGRSAMAADFMASMGYEKLYNLVDGTMGWLAEGLPVEK